MGKLGKVTPFLGESGLLHPNAFEVISCYEACDGIYVGEGLLEVVVE